MSGRFLTDLVDVLRASGLIVHEHPGWQTRARSSGGYKDGLPSHLMCHHTASNPGSDPDGDVSYIASGADGAPLSNLYLSRSGEVWVIAAGATNTNGSGHDWWGGDVPDDSMNTHAIGIEAANNGVGEPWPSVQQEAYLTMCGALCATYGIDNHHVRAHAEWAPDRKIDPAGQSTWAAGSATWDMDSFRFDVADEQPVPIPPPTGDDMATAILHVTGRNAQFIAQGPLLADGSVHCLLITWFGPGPEGNPFLTDHAGAPDVVHQDTLPSTIQRDLVLVGDPEAITDSLWDWSAADFYRVT